MVGQRQHPVALAFRHREVAPLVPQPGCRLVQVQRSAVVDQRLDATLRARTKDLLDSWYKVAESARPIMTSRSQ